MEEKIKNLKVNLEKYGQEHLLSNIDILDEQKKEELLEQIKNIDFEQIKTLYAKVEANNEKNEIKIEPISYVEKNTIEDSEKQKYLNYSNIGYYIPSRYKDGYGITSNMVDLIYQKGYKLIITVDNGVKAIDAMRYAADHDIRLIISDHHTYEIDDIQCDCFLHPFLNDDDK